MDITQVLLNNDKSLQIHNEAEYSGGDSAKLYSSFNSGGVEVEVGEFLYSMVRLLKPERVLETGTHHGISSAYMASAMKQNHKGTLVTTEFLPENHAIADKRFKDLGLDHIIVNHLIDTNKLYTDKNSRYQMIFLDTEPEFRFNELCEFYDNLDEGGYVFIHDLPRTLCQGNVNTDHPEISSWPFGDVPPVMRRLLQTGKLRMFHYPNPRSMTGFYKPTKEDFKW
jgi:predicted O-methyltransferase YrrM